VRPGSRGYETRVTERPEGLVYEPDFLTQEEERTLLDEIAALDFDEIRMHGQVARRTANHYGIAYDYDNSAASKPGEPLPDWLEPVRDRVAALAGVRSDELAEALVQHYPPGAPIGWHRDAPRFGLVAGVSLASPARMRFQRGKGDAREVAEVTLEPGSAYVLAGKARWSWQHSIPPVKQDRYSITFRTLR
jgi:alkylated DNA repair protein (DNA oxidative demethylase)